MIHALTELEWLNEELIEKIDKNPILKKAMQDPQFMIIMNDLGKDPNAAIRKHANAPESYMIAIKEFMKLMGEHVQGIQQEKAFTNMEIPNDIPDHEKKLLSTVMHDKEIQSILREPAIANIFLQSKSQPEALQE
jgi:hypothetical protein